MVGSGGIWDLICTCAYFNKAIKLKLDSSRTQIEQVDGSYIAEYIATQQWNFLEQLCPHLTNVL